MSIQPVNNALADPLVRSKSMPYLGGVSRVFRECYQGVRGEAFYYDYLHQLQGCMAPRAFTSLIDSIPEDHKRTNRQIVQFLFETSKRNMLSYPGGIARWNDFLQEPFNPQSYLNCAPWMHARGRIRLARTGKIVNVSQGIGKYALAGLWLSLVLVVGVVAGKAIDRRGIRIRNQAENLEVGSVLAKASIRYGAKVVEPLLVLGTIVGIRIAIFGRASGRRIIGPPLGKIADFGFAVGSKVGSSLAWVGRKVHLL